MGDLARNAGGRPTLFLRNATGLVKAWSAYDAFIYSFMSVNLVTLGLYGMSFAYAIPQGQLLYAVLFTGVAVTFLVIVYAGLVAAIPRARGLVSRIIAPSPALMPSHAPREKEARSAAPISATAPISASAPRRLKSDVEEGRFRQAHPAKISPGGRSISR